MKERKKRKRKKPWNSALWHSAVTHTDTRLRDVMVLVVFTVMGTSHLIKSWKAS